MNIAYFKAIDDRCNITFRYINKDLKVDRVFNFSRDLNEKVDVCLERIKTNVEKELNKKSKQAVKAKKKQKSTDEIEEVGSTSQIANPELNRPTIEVALLKNDDQIRDVAFRQILAAESFQTENFILKVIEDCYEVVFNCPWVNEIKLPTSILANYYVYPAKLDLQFTSKNECEFTWYRGLPKANEEHILWEKVGTGFTYQATPLDIGHRLKLVCLPRNSERDGPVAEAISKCEVQADPGRCPFDWRHEFTSNRLQGSKFRVVHYNLLADYYADSDYTRAELFPYCPPYALNIDYRKQLFIKELIGYNGDIMCLCEVDQKVFDLDLMPVFGDRGYDGVIQLKGSTAEGLATIFNQDRFELVEKRGMNLGDNVPKLPEFAAIWENVKGNEALQKRLVDRSTALQVTLLRMKNVPNKMILIANTHLYFAPDADHIRLLQAGLAMAHLERVIKEVKEMHSEDEVALIFCGDFNSVPECGIYKLMTEKFVPADYLDWKSSESDFIFSIILHNKLFILPEQDDLP